MRVNVAQTVPAAVVDVAVSQLAGQRVGRGDGLGEHLRQGPAEVGALRLPGSGAATGQPCRGGRDARGPVVCIELGAGHKARHPDLPMNRHQMLAGAAAAHQRFATHPSRLQKHEGTALAMESQSLVSVVIKQLNWHLSDVPVPFHLKLRHAIMGSHLRSGGITSIMTSGTVGERSAAQAKRPNIDHLFIAWQQQGDANAREALVKRFLPLANKLAYRYRGPNEPIEDLKQVASLGLVKAIDRFDSTRGITFQSFAVPTILGELKRYFRDCGWVVHVPRRVQELSLKVDGAQREMTARTGRAATFTEIAQFLEVEVEDVVEALDASHAHKPLSFESPTEGDEDSSRLGDSLGQIDDRFEIVELGATIASAAEQLTDREKRVLALRFIEDRTQTEIARDIGVSQMQVSRILRSSLDRLAAASTDGTVPEQLEAGSSAG
jgi:RNA polymerase sigma-B factor